MANSYFQFKQFKVEQGKSAMKVGVDSVILGSWLRINNPKHILDIGTGTGLLALMMAQRSVDSKIVAVEIDAEAADDAKLNFANSKFSERIRLEHISIQDFVGKNKIEYDLIICNPPYFDTGNRSKNQSRSVARHDDELSLETLFDCAAKLLSIKGELALILPHDKKDKAALLAKQSSLHPNAVLNIYPTPHKEPNRVVLCFGMIQDHCRSEELIVRNNGVYTDEYKSLTQTFYL